MTRLSEIPIRVALASAGPAALNGAAGSTPGAPLAGLGGGIYAIVAELTRLLDGLVRHQQTGVVDLRSLPMSAQDRLALKQLLGEGEVQANFDAEGISHFCETGVPGVWWVEHRDRSGELIAELIEVAGVPEILCSAPDEIAVGSRVLEARLAALAAAMPAPSMMSTGMPAGNPHDATRQ